MSIGTFAGGLHLFPLQQTGPRPPRKSSYPSTVRHSPMLLRVRRNSLVLWPPSSSPSSRVMTSPVWVYPCRGWLSTSRPVRIGRPPHSLRALPRSEPASRLPSVFAFSSFPCDARSGYLPRGFVHSVVDDYLACATLLDNYLSLTGTNNHLALPWVDYYLSFPRGDMYRPRPWTNMPCTMGVDLQHTVRARKLVDILGIQLLFSLH